jgi:hypothetical protein
MELPMIRPALALMVLAIGASTALAQPYYRDRDRDRYYAEGPRYRPAPRGCGREKHNAEMYYYKTMRKGYQTRAEQASQRDLQTQYDACRGRYDRRRY